MKILTRTKYNSITDPWKYPNGPLAVGDTAILRFTEPFFYMKTIPIGESGEYTYKLHLPDGIHECRGEAAFEIDSNTPGVIRDADTGEFVAEIQVSELKVKGGCLLIFTSSNGVFTGTIPGMKEDQPAPDQPQPAA